jgi:hypothetical protein
MADSGPGRGSHSQRVEKKSFSARYQHRGRYDLQVNRPRLEQEFGIRFGAPEAARRFSFETDARPVLLGAKTFGFHGLFNMFAVESQPEIVAFAARLSDSNAKSEMAELLLANLVKFERFAAALALGSRVLECNPENQAVADEVVRAREALVVQSLRMDCGLAARVLGKFRGAP